MKYQRYWLSLLLLALAACASSPQHRTDTEAADLAAIRKYDQDWLAALAKGDAATLRDLSAEDHTTFPNNMPPFEGRDANYATNSKWFEKFNVSESWYPRDLVVSGDWAYECGYFTATSQPKAGGEVSHFTGNYLRILRRQSDGSWKMTREMAAGDRPTSPSQ
jgi:ketosteroid isomerase-like protein